jgi:hypothetical protein
MRVLIPSAAWLFQVYEDLVVSVTQIREPLTLATLISKRCRDFGLSQAEFVSRVGAEISRKESGDSMDSLTGTRQEQKQ